MKYLWSTEKKSKYQAVNVNTQLKLETGKLPIWCMKNSEIDMKVLNQPIR